MIVSTTAKASDEIEIVCKEAAVAKKVRVIKRKVQEMFPPKNVFDEFDTNPWQDEQRQGAGIRPHHRLGGIGRWRRTCVQLTG